MRGAFGGGLADLIGQTSCPNIQTRPSIESRAFMGDGGLAFAASERSRRASARLTIEIASDLHGFRVVVVVSVRVKLTT